MQKEEKERDFLRKKIKSPSMWKHSDFQILETLGTGTFGRVRLCKLKRTENNYYAMKICEKKDIIRLRQVEHIVNEKNTLMDIECPFIVKLYKSYQNKNTLFLIMEYVVGGEIFSHLRKVGKFPNDVAKFFAAEIICALEYLHSKNIVYRDLKPENLLINEDGHIKITDFGFAKIVNDQTFTVCGTPEYLSPEIIQNTGHDKSADWWALGILIYEMLVGYPPYFDDSPFKIYEKILNGQMEFPRFMDTAARDLIKKLLIPNKKMRLGGGENGASEIKSHKWFDGVDWEAVSQRKVPPPISVRVRFAGDSKYYDKYPENQDGKENKELSKNQQDLFKDFDYDQTAEIENLNRKHKRKIRKKKLRKKPSYKKVLSKKYL